MSNAPVGRSGALGAHEHADRDRHLLPRLGCDILTARVDRSAAAGPDLRRLRVRRFCSAPTARSAQLGHRVEQSCTPSEAEEHLALPGVVIGMLTSAAAEDQLWQQCTGQPAAMHWLCSC